MSGFLKKLLTPQSIDCKKEWIFCDKFASFFKILFLAATINLTFSIVRYSQDNMIMFKSNLIGLVIFSTMMFVLHRYNSLYHTFSRIFILLTFLLATLSVSMVEQGTRAIWLATIMVAAFYFRDQKEGTIWAIFFVISTVISEYIYFGNHEVFRVVDTVTLIANFILIAFMMSWYERIKQKDQIKLKEQNIELENLVQERTKELEKLTKTDELTGLCNRRMLYDVLEDMLSTLAKQRKSFIFVMADIDHFKSYNDTYGHQKGDDALKKVSELLQDEFSSKEDYIFRLGGEEFGIILTDLSSKEAYERIVSVRLKVHKLSIEHKASPTAKILTMSFGVEHVLPDEKTNFDDIYKKADEKLYQAKKLGRDRVII